MQVDNVQYPSHFFLLVKAFYTVVTRQENQYM